MDGSAYLHLDAGYITSHLSAAGLDIEVELCAEGVRINVWSSHDDSEQLLGTTWKNI